VRIVAASATDLSELVARGTFRADLYYRLRQLEVVMPPLRDRPEDIPLLIDHILCEWTCERGQTARLSPLAEDLVLAHHWPGNVRELRNALRGAAVLAESGVITPQQLPRAVRNAGGSTPVVERLENVERQAIARALDRAGGNQSQAARLLGIDRGTLARKLLRRPL
jgi:DNA-binding NtrC family response regulator